MTVEGASLRAILSAQVSQELFDKSQDAVYILNLDGSFLDANDVLLNRLSTTREALLSTVNFQPTVSDDELDMVKAHFERAIAGETVRYLATALDFNGQTFRSEIVNSPLILDGVVVAVLGVARDIGPTEQKAQAHEQLEQRFTRALDTISDGIMFIDTEWLITYANPRCEIITGLPLADLEGHSIFNLMLSSLSAETSTMFRTAMREQRTKTVNSYSPDIDRWYETTAYPSPNGLALHIRDVTETKAALARAQESEKTVAAQAALLDIATDAIVVRDLNHVVSYWNSAAAELYGWTSQEAVGRSVIELSYAQETDAYELAHARALRDGFWSGELEQFTKSQQTLSMDCRWSVIYDEDGKPESILAVNTDITERKRAAEKSARAERMESLGALAGGIAHDLNNILTPMLMSVQLLAEGETDPVNLEILQLLESGVKGGADMVRQVVSFARGVESRKIQVDIPRLVRDIDAFARNSLPATVTVVSRVDADVPPVLGDPAQLMQVLVNLVTNSRDAMSEGGTLTIHARSDAGNHTVIDVTDTGDGMSEHTLGSIFEPFFTTKPPGIGTGLGLATSARVIDNHNGRLTATSALGTGTTFTIYFPSAEFTDALSQSGEADSQRLPPRGTGEWILVVDDNPAIQATAQIALEQGGYTVATASNGAEALTVIARLDCEIDLVFTDMTMPVMGGMEAAESICAHHPSIPMVATSGYAMSDNIDLAKTVGIKNFLPKPYTTAELLWAVHNALHSKPEGG
ncbi:MAG: PAS domain-containing hybrid sensor histidine kinase/response regulator [Microbacteriaceae bacterium]